MRISGLPKINNCPGFHVLSGLIAKPAGSSATAGTAVGEAIERFHRGGSPKAIEAWLDGACPKTFAPAFKKIFVAYCEDSRNNKGDVLEKSLELEVKVQLAPCSDDPVQEPITLVGHTDQIRRDPVLNRLYVWDVKSGQPTGRQMLYSYAWQLAGYALAATETLGEPVFVGGIIRVRDYQKKRKDSKIGPVFYEAGWSPEACEKMLGTLKQHIAWLHQGYVHLQPGPHCEWCPGENPAACPAELERILV